MGVKRLTSLAAASIAASVFAAPAWAADIPAGSLKLAPGVVQAKAYETPPAKYIVTNGTPIFSDVHVYGTKETGELKRGDHVDALAKVKDDEWLLVGKGGQGIGYVPISMTSPEDKYVP